MSTTLKPWPRDTVVIVCAPPAEFVPQQCRGVATIEYCWDCGCMVYADSYTIERAETMPERCERDLQFLCLSCARAYNFAEVEIFQDLRKGK